MYAECSPFDVREIKVSELHTLHVEQFGNPDGYPVVYLHGGPGSGCSYKEYRMFNLDVFRVILFDQRGCGRSLPFAEVREQSLDALISDLEVIRTTLGIERWSLVGGSWGTCYALLYTKQHYQRVDRVLLRALTYSDRNSVLDLCETGASRAVCPDYWDCYSQWDKVLAYPSLVEGYYQLSRSEDMEIALEAARRFMVWDTAIATAEPWEDLLDEVRNDLMAQLPITRFWFHFARNEFSKRDGMDLKSVEAFRNIEFDLVHGNRDHICPIESSYEFIKLYPHARLHEIDGAGHIMADPMIWDGVEKIIAEWEKAFS